MTTGERPMPTTYRNQIRSLERTILRYEELLRRHGVRVPTRHAAMSSKCGQCGAEPKEPCRHPNNITCPTHHVRGRAERCRPNCVACSEVFT